MPSMHKVLGPLPVPPPKRKILPTTSMLAFFGLQGEGCTQKTTTWSNSPGWGCQAEHMFCVALSEPLTPLSHEQQVTTTTAVTRSQPCWLSAHWPQNPHVGRSLKHFRKTWPIISVNLCCLDRLNPGPKWLSQLTIFLSKRQKSL